MTLQRYPFFNKTSKKYKRNPLFIKNILLLCYIDQRNHVSETVMYDKKGVLVTNTILSESIKTSGTE